jgi:RimJ/RimL family protein N-acetyltransferase
MSANNPNFWGEIRSGKCLLTRRGDVDADFIRSLWALPEFIYAFHRHARPLPKTNQELKELLRKEYLATVYETRALHWIVRDLRGNPFGLLSLVDISFPHKLAEVLIGVAPGTPSRLALAAMLTLFEFYFRVIRFHKLYSQIYSDNSHALNGALNLGFFIEGVLRRHVMDPRSGKFIDLIQLGLFSDEAFSAKNQRLISKLLSQHTH